MEDKVQNTLNWEAFIDLEQSSLNHKASIQFQPAKRITERIFFIALSASEAYSKDQKTKTYVIP